MLAELAASATLAAVSAPHCAAMCGPLSACVARCDRRREGRYHLGRAVAYVAGGAVAGALGRGLGLAVAGAWLSATAAWAVALFLALAAIRAWRGGAGRAGEAPVPLRRRPRGPLARLLLLPPAVAGALTTLLPCGALWAALALSLGSGSATLGGATMAVFAAVSGVAVATSSRLLGSIRGRLGGRAFAAALGAAALLFAAMPLGHLAAPGSPPSCPMHRGPG